MSSTFSIDDICERFGVSRATVLRWIRVGELLAVNVSRRRDSKKPRWRVSAEALAQFERLRTPTPPPPRASRRKRPGGVIEFYK
jgi:excisionase family DNA binding protein